MGSKLALTLAKNHGIYWGKTCKTQKNFVPLQCSNEHCENGLHSAKFKQACFALAGTILAYFEKARCEKHANIIKEIALRSRTELLKFIYLW